MRVEPHASQSKSSARSAAPNQLLYRCMVQHLGYMGPHQISCTPNLIKGSMDLLLKLREGGRTSDGYPYGVESSTLDLLKILERNPVVPVLFENTACIFNLQAQGPFIDNRSILSLETRRCYPAILHPSAMVRPGLSKTRTVLIRAILRY